MHNSYVTEPEIFRTFHLLHWSYLLSQVLFVNPKTLRQLVTHQISVYFLAYITSSLAYTETGRIARPTGKHWTNRKFSEKSHPLLFQSPCHSGLYSFSFVWGRYQNNLIWNISGKKYAQCTLNDIISGSPVCLIHVHYVWDASKIYTVNCLVRHFHNLFVIGFCNLVRWDRNWISEKGRGETKKKHWKFHKIQRYP